MRDLVLLLAVAGLVPAALFSPLCGVLTWAWVAFMSPHRQVYGIATSVPFNMIVAAITIFGLIASREKLKWKNDASIILIILFTAWFLLTTVFSLTGSASWVFFDRHWKTMLFAVLIFLVIDRRTRLHAFVLIVIASLAYYGIKGGGFVLLLGGGDRVWGPPGTEIADNNHLALALVMAIPLLNYARLQLKQRFLRYASMAAMFLMTVAVIGSYSRGGLVGLAVVLFVMFLKTKFKIPIIFVSATIIALAINFMPQEWEDRMSSLRDPLSDASFLGRVEAWEVNLRVALDRPLVGGGFQAPQSREVYYTYKPDAEKPRAAHSLYFQVLGEHGFVGLFLFLGICWCALVNASRIRRMTRHRPQFGWAFDLATMIQVSIVSYMVAGLALSMAYYDVFYAMVALLAAMKRTVEQSVASAVAKPATVPMQSGQLPQPGLGRFDAGERASP